MKNREFRRKETETRKVASRSSKRSKVNMKRRKFYRLNRKKTQGGHRHDIVYTPGVSSARILQALYLRVSWGCWKSTVLFEGVYFQSMSFLLQNCCFDCIGNLFSKIEGIYFQKSDFPRSFVGKPVQPPFNYNKHSFAPFIFNWVNSVECNKYVKAGLIYLSAYTVGVNIFKREWITLYPAFQCLIPLSVLRVSSFCIYGYCIRLLDSTFCFILSSYVCAFSWTCLQIDCQRFPVK